MSAFLSGSDGLPGQLLRRRQEEIEKAQLYTQALKSDLDYACQIVAVLSFFEGIAEEKPEYEFSMRSCTYESLLVFYQ
jgi:hypothetical protein